MRIARNLLLAALALVAAASLAGPPPARAGDPSVARTLLESGKKALAARKVDEAVAHFRKALAEDANLVEAAYWIGAARDKDKDDAGALAAYREFLSLLEKRGNPSSDEGKLKALADKRVDALAAAEKEFQKLEDKYVEDLLAFARAKYPKEPAVAALALEGVPASRSVKEWRDLLRERAISSDAITFPGEVMAFDAKDGTKVTSKHPIDEGGNLVYEMEFRVTDVHDPGWLAGLSFSEKTET